MALLKHDAGRGPALAHIRARTLMLSITSNVLFPLSEQLELESGYGHDGFLLETKQISERLEMFYAAAMAA